MKPHIKEAYRYLDNAKTIIKEKLKKEGDFYNDPKYIKMAGHTAYTGVLMALAPFVEPTKKKAQRLDVDDYKKALAQRNKLILKTFNEAYNYLHLYMGYDGSLSVDTKNTGFKYAEQLIHWADQNTPEPDKTKKG